MMGRFLSKAENDKSKWVDVVPVAIVDNENSAGVAMAVADGADITQGAKADAPYADNDGSDAGSVVSLLKGLYVAIKTAVVSVGDVASGTVDSGNPVKVGAVVDSTKATLIAGRRTNLLADLKGNLWVTLGGSGNTIAAQIINAAADATSNAIGSLAVGNQNYVFNGATWDRQRDISNANGTAGIGVQASGMMGFDGVVYRRIGTGPSAADANAGSGLMTVANWVYNGATFDRVRGDTAGLWTNQAPSVAASVALTSVKSAALETGKVIKAAAGNLYGLNLVATVGGMFLVHNSATVPAAGAVTPVKAYPVVAGQAIDISFNPPIRFSTGISVSFTTAATPFTQTDSATAFISGDAA